jgi:uncharacterized membrane protein
MPTEPSATASRSASLSASLSATLSATLLCGLIFLGLAWELWLAPLRPGGSWLVLKVLPLLLPLRGMLHGSRYASKWLTLLVMIYFTEGVVRSVTERELSQWLAMAETAMACALFVTAIVHVRSTRKALPAA